MACKIIFCFEFPDIPDKAGRKTRIRRTTQAIVKRYAFHANAISKSKLYPLAEITDLQHINFTLLISLCILNVIAYHENPLILIRYVKPT